jgi:hypothetical protein
MVIFLDDEMFHRYQQSLIDKAATRRRFSAVIQRVTPAA